jgi:enoyl-CoA hydratase/carnithine racemase
MSEPSILDDGNDSIAVITLNRPEKLNALTNDMVGRVADAVAEATASAEVGAIVLRGAGGTLTAGYDLSSVQEFSGPTQPDTRDTPYDAPGPQPRTLRSRPIHKLPDSSHAGSQLALGGG